MKQGSLYSISGNQILNSLEWLSFRCLFAIRPPASELRVELVISEGSSKPMHQFKILCISSTIGYCEHAIKAILLNSVVS